MLLFAGFTPESTQDQVARSIRHFVGEARVELVREMNLCLLDDGLLGAGGLGHGTDGGGEDVGTDVCRDR